MEFEAKITSFATGLLILGSYMILFDLWDYTGFLIVVSSILLLLVAFRDFQFKKIIVINVIFALLLSIFFLKYQQNWIYIPIVAVLILCIMAFNAKLETFLPPLAGVLSLQFIDPNFLMKGIRAIFLNLAPLLGIRGAFDPFSYLHLYYTRTHLPIFVDEIKILLPFYFAIFVAQVVLLILVSTNWKTALKSLPIAGILPFFFSLLTLVHLVHNPSTAFFIPDNWQALLFPLTCIFLISAWTPGAKIKKLEETNSSSSKSKKVTCVLLIVFFSLAILYYTPLETRSDPIVIIDEFHSEWEPTWTDYIEAYEEDPVSGVNNYYGLLHVLSSLYDVTLIIDKPEKVPSVSTVKTVLVDDGISLQTLKQIAQDREAVLILKCVTKPYSQAECEAIMQFLAEGNGLILIGEHTNLYDMGTNLNPFAERLGYRYLPTGIQDIYSESRGTITQSGEFPALIARYLTGDFLWETGCSLEKLDGKDRGSNSLFEVRSRPSCFAHYENETSPFFLTRVFTEEIKLNCEFHRFLTVAGVKYGEGKAILWTDSTPFNNGLIGSGEHLQLFIGMIEWVDSKEGFNKAFMPFLLLAIALIAIALNRKRPIKVVVVIAILLLLAFNLSYPLAHYTTQFPELKTEPKAIGILIGEDYYDLYFSAALDVSEVMDEYFRQNLTAIMFPEPSEDWFRVCSEVRELHG